MEKQLSPKQAEGASDAASRESETPRQRSKRTNGAQRTLRAPHPSTPSADVPIACASRCAAYESPHRRTDVPQPRQSKRIATPRPKLPLTPGGNMPMASPPMFSVGTAPPRRAETLLQGLNRVNRTRLPSAESKPLQPFQCMQAARPPRPPSEPFLSPSFRPRFPVSVRSAKPPMPSAKAKLDFSEERPSAPAASRPSAPKTSQPAAQQGDPRLEVLARRIQICVDERRWHDVMRVIEEALQLDPESTIYQSQQALARSHILEAETRTKRRLEAEAAMRRHREAERAQRTCTRQVQQAIEKSYVRTFYDVLNVRSSATSDEIKSSYRVLLSMDEEKARAYVELASKMTELHASIALLSQNVDKMARTDAEVTSMTKIFQGVFKNASEQSKFREA